MYLLNHSWLLYVSIHRNTKHNCAVTDVLSTAAYMLIILQVLTRNFLATFANPKLKEIDVQMLIEKRGLGLNVPNTAGNTLLHIAVLQGSVELTKTILVADPFGDVNITNNEGQTPLHIAIAMEQTTINQVLFSVPVLSGGNPPNSRTQAHLSSQSVAHLLVTDRRCNLTIGNHDGNTLLHLAAIAGDSGLCKLILSNKWCDPNVLNKDGAAPLHIGTLKNDLDVIKTLLGHHLCNPSIVYNKGDIVSRQLHPNSDGNTTGKVCSGATPLHIAAEMGNVQLCELLTSHRECDINFQDKKGNTAVHIALLKNRTGRTQAHLSSQSVAHLLVTDRRCNLTIRNHDGNTLLHLAAIAGDSDLCKLILSNKRCDPNVLNKDGAAPLHIATMKSDLDVIQTLLSHHLCKPNIVYNKGNIVSRQLHPNSDGNTGNVCSGATPLHIAAEMGNVQLCKLLASHRECDINLQDKEGNTAVHIALLKNSSNVTKALINHSLCDMNMQDISGSTYLHLAIERCKSNIADMLINKKCDLTVPNSNGDTPLHLACVHASRDPAIMKVARSLLASGTVDPSCANNAGQTPVELTTNYQLIQDISHFTECITKHSVQTYIKLFILGNPSTGKSTLVKAICKEASWWLRLLPGLLRRVKNVPAKTAGIIPTTFRSKTFGNTILYDLAGQYEYYSSHAAVIENTVFSSPPAFLVVIDLSEDDEKIVKQLKYWWSFISNHAAKANAPPQVILVGSHADMLISRGIKVDDKLSHLLSISKELSASFHFAGHVALDCRDPVSRGLKFLCSLVNTSCTALRASADVDLRCHALYAFLLEKFGNTVACSVSDIATQLTSTDTLLPKHPVDVIQLLSSLSSRGLIFLVENSEHVGHSRVILQKQILLNEICGTIFAPESFSQHRKFSSTGIIPRAKIQRDFPHYDTNMIIDFLTSLEFCFQVEDTEILHKIYEEFSASNEDLPVKAVEASDEFYFFPGLVSIDNPLSVWKDDGSMCYQCGWHYESANPDQFLTTRFLHVLVLRLAFLFSLPAVNQQPSSVLCKRCSVWKHGIGWLNEDGIEVVVEVGLQYLGVTVLMRCPDDAKMKCVELRSKIIREVLQAKQKYCEALRMTESFVHPSQIQYPVTNCDKLFLVTDISNAIAKKGKRVIDQHGHSSVPIEELLFFEPYVGIGGELLIELFNEDNACRSVPEAFLAKFAEQIDKRMSLYREAIEPAKTAFEEAIKKEDISTRQCLILLRALCHRIKPTYRNFHRELDRFSIFCGRYPLTRIFPS